jgi:hypothetical protein
MSCPPELPLETLGAIFDAITPNPRRFKICQRLILVSKHWRQAVYASINTLLWRPYVLNSVRPTNLKLDFASIGREKYRIEVEPTRPPPQCNFATIVPFELNHGDYNAGILVWKRRRVHISDGSRLHPFGAQQYTHAWHKANKLCAAYHTCTLIQAAEMWNNKNLFRPYMISVDNLVPFKVVPFCTSWGMYDAVDLNIIIYVECDYKRNPPYICLTCVYDKLTLKFKEKYLHII